MNNRYAMNDTDENFKSIPEVRGRKGGSARRKGKSARGFASMDPDEQRKIASKGGRAAHRQGTAHEWTSEEAKAAGRKGGQS